MRGYFLNIAQIVLVSLFLIAAGNKVPPNKQLGKASYYGREFEGRKTANGEIFRNADFTAAHRTMAFHTIVRVTNLKNSLTITVRINDRGPFVRSRIIDLSEAAARRIGSYKHGLASVKVEPMNLLQKNREIDSLFTCEDVTDCLGNPERLSGMSLSLWRTKDIVHMLYVANELYLHEDVEKVYIVGLGTGNTRTYHLVLSGYPNKQKTLEAIDYFERKGFMEVKFLLNR
ncbi:MAG: septal ring lytic transglycosylase RlpA family protein [Bacteroidia bacterium]|nr:septal ring lytic transglycosylase RlpA family protein [Bacteroidia bacterium]